MHSETLKNLKSTISSKEFEASLDLEKEKIQSCIRDLYSIANNNELHSYYKTLVDKKFSSGDASFQELIRVLLSLKSNDCEYSDELHNILEGDLHNILELRHCINGRKNTILTVPHHGAETNINALLEMMCIFKPHALIVSSGSGSLYPHPHQNFIELFGNVDFSKKAFKSDVDKIEDKMNTFFNEKGLQSIVSKFNREYKYNDAEPLLSEGGLFLNGLVCTCTRIISQKVHRDEAFREYISKVLDDENIINKRFVKRRGPSF